VPAWGGAGLGWCRPGVVPAYYLLLIQPTDGPTDGIGDSSIA